MNEMPQLTGTEKQIRWAEQIRAAFVEEVDLLSEGSKFAVVYQERAPQIIAAFGSAAWWIDRRGSVLNVKRLLRTHAERGSGRLCGEDNWTTADAEAAMA